LKARDPGYTNDATAHGVTVPDKRVTKFGREEVVDGKG
jgi:hypothetical protein